MVTTETNIHTGLSIDIPTELERPLHLIAAQRNISILQYIVETLEERLARDRAELADHESLTSLSAQTDPVLAELWDNDKDAIYDQLFSDNYPRANASARAAASSGVAA